MVWQNMRAQKRRGIFNQIRRLFAKEKKKEEKELAFYLEMVNRSPMNANFRLKLAEIYHKKGENQKALSESLLAAENFCNIGHYRKGLATYIKILKDHPCLDDVQLKIAGIYKEMGFSEEAFSQYYRLYNYYNKMGLKDKASEIAVFMADLDPQKFSIGEERNLGFRKLEKGFKAQEVNGKIFKPNLNPPIENKKQSFFDLAAELESGAPANLSKSKSIAMEEGFAFERIIKEVMGAKDIEKIYPNFNYQMGLVYKEMGLIDEALEQFQIALKENQKPSESAKFLDLCRLEKNKEIKII
jgi:tetratricopeptide (TPR) repeat protein